MLIYSCLPSTGGQGPEKGSLASQSGRGAGFSEAGPSCVLIITKAMEPKSKKQFQHGDRIGSSLQR